MYKLYTDGATSNNGYESAIGGWAFVLLNNDELLCSRAEKVEQVTNNACEMMAIIAGCKEVMNYLSPFDSVEVYSDSAYCINCVNQRWYRKWQVNEWKTSSKEPVKNKELWEQLIPFFEDPHFKWYYVKGHNGNQYNEMVDKMAVNARLS